MEDDELYIDVNDGLKRVINNKKLYVKLLGKFKEDPSFNEIDTAFISGDMAKAQDSTHALKGLSANLSLNELHKQCVELEKQIKAGSVDPTQIETVKNVYDQTLVEVDKVIALYV
jgi:HPt (histidine-containing phosphotransfer) domain-containing protein